MAVAGALLLVSLVSACAPYRFRGAAYDPPVPAPDFSLSDTHGQPFRLSERQGEAVLLTFGYTSCPDICPATLALAQQALNGLGQQAGRVTLVFVTVDPLRDTPPILEAYLGRFSPAFVGLTGDPVELAQVLEAYGIAVEFNPPSLPGLGYTADHSARLYLIDASGRLRAQYPAGVTADELRQDIDFVLSDA